MKNKVLKVLHIILLFVISAAIVSAIYFKISFPLASFDSNLLTFKDGTKNADSTVLIISLKAIAPFVILLFAFLWALFYKVLKKHKWLYTIIGIVVSIIMLLWSVGFFNYLYFASQKSDFIKNNYVDPKDTSITFNEKRNLIFIMAESLETSLFTKDEGGYWNYEVIPELYNLLNDEDAVVFYNKKIDEELSMIRGSSWTTASVVANTSSLPLKVNLEDLNKDNYLSKAYTIGDILKDNGYTNELISASNTTFGNVGNYFKTHGDYQIVDIDSLDKYGFEITKEDLGPWGFNDNYLFEIAKKRLDELSKEDKPFNLHLITIDPHFMDGYVGNYSVTKYKEQYENSYATESKLIYDFISWIKEQPYYKNTTIVILGDHLCMQSSFINKQKLDDRYVYSVIINPVNKEAKYENRVYTALDTFPTVVSAIGGNIKGNKLGLGTNLFSNKSTLAEKYGINKLDDELKKSSKYYNDMK